MKTFHISFLMDNSFDTINRVLNKFCGRGYQLKSVDVNHLTDEKKAVLNLSLSADLKGLEIISKKLLTYVDVYKLIDFSEIRKVVAI